MKKLLTLTLALTVLFLTSAFAANQVEVTKIIAPTTGSDITIDASFTVTVEITNNTTSNFTSSDSAAIYIGFYNGSSIVNPTAIALLTGKDIPVGQAINFDFSMKFNASTPAGTYSFGFGLYWPNNPNPTNITFQLGNYNLTSSTSDIEENEFNISKLYFANGNINLELNNSGSKNISYEIYNLNGQLIKNDNLTLSGTGTVSESIELNAIENGMYIIRLNVEGRLYNQKFIVR